MSDPVIQSYHDGDDKAEQSKHSFQSVWLSHWMRTSCRAAPQVHNETSLGVEKNNDYDANKHHLQGGLEVASDISLSTEGFTEVTEARTIRIMNNGLATSSKNLIKKKLDCHRFPGFSLCQNMRCGLDPQDNPDSSCDGQVSRPQIDCNIEHNASTTVSHFPLVREAVPTATETLSKCYFQSNGISHHAEEPLSPPKVSGDDNLALVGPCQDNFTRLNQMVPYRSDKGKAPMLSFMSRQEEMNHLVSAISSKEHISTANATILKHEHDNYKGCSAILACEKKLDDCSTCGKSGTSFPRQSNASLSIHVPLKGNNHLPVLIGDRYQKMHNCSGSGFIPSWRNSPDATNSEKLYHGFYSMLRIPSSIHDLETTRICRRNLMDGLAGNAAPFSETNRSLLLVKKADVSWSKEYETFRESTVSDKSKGNMFNQLLSSSTPSGLGQRVVKLQPLGSSTDSEGKDDTEDIRTPEVCLKNESSAETNTMDIDAFKEQNHIYVGNSSASDKDILVGQNPPSHDTVASAGEEEVECRLAITRLPDINEEIPALPAGKSSVDNAEPSNSKTLSLDAEHLLHAEQPSNPSSNHYPNNQPTLDPDCRWLKRLRLSDSVSIALGTKCSSMGDPSSHEKVNKLFNKIIKDSKDSSLETTPQKSHGKEEMTAAQTSISFGKRVFSSVGSGKRDKDMLLSNSWIRRWCRNQAATEQGKPKVAVVCEPRSRKMEFHELQNKQSPSLAAMALMAKAMTGFPPCELRRTGSFVVWNTKGF
ncbi:uncharacterized protein LOC127801396 [Diospyros lotus]|uniref:uncharacterized protein LOC127801396 n=1 Tax=Diospyros lotus TaxID=55363 RepID=UPI00225AD0DC|nr:uncharacterized protein LOC127801396 [Diospyros lotus]XP_052192456.1 uncharacterized protein LOC127801396 [Diospyros lotus]XP_052192457.1 uncharacterized protein LOC127801396 [Diospyros lotus]XP_052192458.1 uncharacterized protein LOC127801396 [Diospyros lotus]